ncbi:tryptophan--tRNA ligase [Candidatus Saccharibacteria bacterium]|nr:tryptophan--tRNA ligase [Candidatus Saccharibacteria bacterium]
MKDTILTGVRVNETPTLGNFLGAYMPMVQLAQKYANTHNINMFIPDLHSITTPINYSELQQNIIDGVRYYIAAGLDTSQVNMYRQSYIPAHSELTWILDCFSYTGELGRMIQFKEKSAEHPDGVTMGLFNYPVLMAVDILLYGAKYVPVGEDQYQHLEITRDIAIRFNNKFGEIFVIPVPTKEQSKFMNRSEGLRVRSLTDPEKKMSKSSRSENSKISLDDNPETAAKKIMSATTDSVGLIQFDMFNQPGVSNLLQILALLQARSLQEVVGEWAGQTNYGELKTTVAAEVENFLADFQAKVAKISDQDVLKALEAGEKRVTPIANAKLLEVQKAVGLR